MKRKYTSFTKTFKLQTLELANQPDTCVAQLARNLGLRRNMIYKWRVELNKKQDKAFKRTADDANTAHHKATHSELLKQNKQLEKDLKFAQMEYEILKKAQAFFKDQNI